MKKQKCAQVKVFENPIKENEVADFVVFVTIETKGMKSMTKGFRVKDTLKMAESTALKMCESWVNFSSESARKGKENFYKISSVSYDGNVIKLK